MTTTFPPVPGSRLTQRAALLAAAQVAAFAISFALPLVLVRTLSRLEYGVYKQAFQIVATALGGLNLQVAVSAVYFMTREPEKRLQVAMNVLLFYFLVGALVAALFFVYPEWVVLIFKTRDLVPYVPLLGVVILLWLVSTNIEVVPLAIQDFRSASAFIVISQCTKAVLLIIAGLAFSSVIPILVAAALHGVLQTMILLCYLRRRFGGMFAPLDWALFRAQMRSALPFGAGGLPAIVQADLHYYVVSHYFDAATFAIYSVGCFQLPLLSLLGTAFSGALLPEVARREKDRDYSGIIDVWASAIRSLAFLILPAFAFLFVMRHDVITVLFTRDYEAAVPIFAINLLTVPLSITTHYPVLRAFDALKYFRLKLYLGLLPLTWLALRIGLRVSGLHGAVAAAVFVQMLDVGITITVVARKLDMSWRDLRRLAPVLWMAGAAAMAALAVVSLKPSLPVVPPLVGLLICGAAFVPAYLAAAFVAGVFSPALPVRLQQGPLGRLQAALDAACRQRTALLHGERPAPRETLPPPPTAIDRVPTLPPSLR